MPRSGQDDDRLTYGRRLILVSNRLPVTIRKKDTGIFEYHRSTGGLVSGIKGLLRSRSFLWYGWPGLSVPESSRHQVEGELLLRYDAIPVWLSSLTADLHYNEFSNRVLWPLLHSQQKTVTPSAEAWKAYIDVNRLFAETLSVRLRDGDMIWIHDFHLFLLPSFLRTAIREKATCKNVRIGFFLHTPFPKLEAFANFHFRNEIIDSLLKSNLIGFHTESYVFNFLEVCASAMGTHSKESDWSTRIIQKVQALPIGIDVEKFLSSLEMTRVKKSAQNLKRKFDGRKIICGIDRLDLIKGIPQKLEAFELFLARHPEWYHKVLLIQYIIPSREALPETAQLKAKIDKIAYRVNSTYKIAGWEPIILIHGEVGFEDMVALYSTSHVCVVSSLMDGMNLVSSEYIACQQLVKGILLLSKFAGAATILLGSILINPYETSDFAEALDRALKMNVKEREQRWETSFQQIRAHGSQAWGDSFIHQLGVLPHEDSDGI